MNDRELIKEGAAKLGLTLTSTQLKNLLEYKEYMLEVNKTLNLTSIIETEDFIIKHYFDSFSLCEVYDFKEAERVLDMGTGAGIPGIPLKILYPDIYFVLADSLNKRIQFLNDVVKRLDLDNVECMHGRAEDLGHNIDLRESFDVVVSRAVASLAVLSEYCLPFLKIDGIFLCLKGPKYKEELEESKIAIAKLGGRVEKIESINLPFSKITHYILIIKKIEHTSTNFPRKAGKPTKSPLK